MGQSLGSLPQLRRRGKTGAFQMGGGLGPWAQLWAAPRVVYEARDVEFVRDTTSGKFNKTHGVHPRELEHR